MCVVWLWLTSFSQSQRTVMMARMSVWTAVPPIIPAQIPCKSFAQRISGGEAMLERSAASP